MRTAAPGRPLLSAARGPGEGRAQPPSPRGGGKGPQWRCVPSQRPRPPGPHARVLPDNVLLEVSSLSTEELAEAQAWPGPWGARFARSGRDAGL